MSIPGYGGRTQSSDPGLLWPTHGLNMRERHGNVPQLAPRFSRSILGWTGRMRRLQLQAFDILCDKRHIVIELMAAFVSFTDRCLREDVSVERQMVKRHGCIVTAVVQDYLSAL